MFTFELAQRLRADGERSVPVNALHPATFMNTKMSYEAGIAPVSSIKDGVDATMLLAVSSELDGATGRYFEGMTESRAGDQAYDAVPAGACGGSARPWSGCGRDGARREAPRRDLDGVDPGDGQDESNAVVNWPVRSRTRNRKAAARSSRSIARLRACWTAGLGRSMSKNLIFA